MNAQMRYLEADVLSASGPKLRLMLIEAALRLSRQGLRELRAANLEAAIPLLSRVRKIFWELLNSVSTQGDMAENIRRIYDYLIRTVTEAQLSGDPKKVDDMIRILEVECATWREVNKRYIAETAQKSDSSATQSGDTPSSPDGFSAEV